jgi:hypothetical protein
MEEKVSLPTKTKIAAWWMRLLGIERIILALFILFGIWRWVLPTFAPSHYFSFYSVQSLISGFIGGLICFISFPLTKGKKWAWWGSVIVFFLLCLGWLGCWIGMFVLCIGNMSCSVAETFQTIMRHLSFLIEWLIPPLILLLLDCKNFWKIAK